MCAATAIISKFFGGPVPEQKHDPSCGAFVLLQMMLARTHAACELAMDRLSFAALYPLCFIAKECRHRLSCCVLSARKSAVLHFLVSFSHNRRWKFSHSFRQSFISPHALFAIAIFLCVYCSPGIASLRTFVFAAHWPRWFLRLLDELLSTCDKSMSSRSVGLHRYDLTGIRRGSNVTRKVKLHNSFRNSSCSLYLIGLHACLSCACMSSLPLRLSSNSSVCSNGRANLLHFVSLRVKVGKANFNSVCLSLQGSHSVTGCCGAVPRWLSNCAESDCLLPWPWCANQYSIEHHRQNRHCLVSAACFAAHSASDDVVAWRDSVSAVFAFTIACCCFTQGRAWEHSFLCRMGQPSHWNQSCNGACFPTLCCWFPWRIFDEFGDLGCLSGEQPRSFANFSANFPSLLCLISRRFAQNFKFRMLKNQDPDPKLVDFMNKQVMLVLLLCFLGFYRFERRNKIVGCLIVGWLQDAWTRDMINQFGRTDPYWAQASQSVFVQIIPSFPPVCRSGASFEWSSQRIVGWISSSRSSHSCMSRDNQLNAQPHSLLSSTASWSHWIPPLWSIGWKKNCVIAWWMADFLLVLFRPILNSRRFVWHYSCCRAGWNDRMDKTYKGAIPWGEHVYASLIALVDLTCWFLLTW